MANALTEEDFAGRNATKFSWVNVAVILAVLLLVASIVIVLRRPLNNDYNLAKSKDHVKLLVTMMIARRVEPSGTWPRYSGKNFVLSLVATGQLDRRNLQNLEVLFSPGDVLYSLENVDLDRYGDVTKEALAQGADFHELTSYAGRRNTAGKHLITDHEEKMGTIVICDDDDGPLHHFHGIVVAYSNGAVRFLEWEDLDMEPPADADDPRPFLGDDATVPELRKVSSR